MATVTSTFPSFEALSAAADFYAVWHTTAIRLSRVAFDNVLELGFSSISVQSQARVVGVLGNGDAVTLEGANLLGYPRTITHIDYRFDADDTVLAMWGEVRVASASTYPTGYVEQVYVARADPETASITLYGNADVAVSGEYTIERMVWRLGESSWTNTGAFSADTWITNNGYGVAVYGAAETLRISDGVHTLNVSGMQVDINLSAWVGDYLEVALSGADSVSGGSAGDFLFGYAAEDHISGLAGSDTLDGGSGADTLAGGPGNDVYAFVESQDSLQESVGEGTDTVSSALSFTLGANLENLTLIGTADIYGTGNELPNLLTGNAGHNRLEGKGGIDTLRGGYGDDIYLVGSGDRVVEAAAAGSDTVRSLLGWTLSANVETLLLLGTAAVNGTGNPQGNTLSGNPGANRLRGLAGNDSLLGAGGPDTLEGGDGNDTLAGGLAADLLQGGAGEDSLAGAAGKDTLSGGTGADRFVFDSAPASAGRDLVTDFTPGLDTLLVDGAAYAALAGGVGPSMLRAGPGVSAAGDADDYLLYDTDTGALYYDPDGTGTVAAVRFATLGLTAHPSISSADFAVTG